MKILLIDDDSDDRLLFREAIQEISPEIACITEQDGRKALADLNNIKIGLPDVIFVDINMPSLDGWECLDKIKGAEITKGIPVIMFSTSSSEKELVRATHSGAVSLLTKPDNFIELKNLLLEIITTLDKNLPLDFLQLKVVPAVGDDKW
jgi:CheY-like chemotaxis protein